MEAGSSSRSAKKYREFILLILSDKSCTRIPDHFCHGLKHELENKVSFMDHAGTQFAIVVEKKERKGYFSNGLGNILSHYKLHDGCYLTLWCCNGDSFEIIEIKDLRMHKIKPPRPPKTYGLGLNEQDNQIHIDSDGSDGYEQMGEGETNMDMDEANSLDNYELASCFIIFDRLPS